MADAARRAVAALLAASAMALHELRFAAPNRDLVVPLVISAAAGAVLPRRRTTDPAIGRREPLRVRHVWIGAAWLAVMVSWPGYALIGCSTAALAMAWTLAVVATPGSPVRRRTQHRHVAALAVATGVLLTAAPYRLAFAIVGLDLAARVAVWVRDFEPPRLRAIAVRVRELGAGLAIDAVGGTGAWLDRTLRPHPVATPSRRRPSAFAVGAGLVTIATAWIIASISEPYGWLEHPTGDPFGWRTLVAASQRFDALHYVDIAAHGYRLGPLRTTTTSWFPGYPLVIRVVHLAIPDWPAAALVTSAVSALVALVLFDRWLAGHREPGSTRRLAIVLVCVYPYSFWLFSMAYAESLFLCAALATILLLERNRPVAAGLACSSAFLIRPAGLVLLPIVVLAAVIDVRGSEVLHRWRRWGAGVTVSALGLVGYVAYAAWAWGDPLRYVHGQAVIESRPAPLDAGTWLLTDAAWGLVHVDLAPLSRAHLALQLTLLVAALLALAPLRRRYGPIAAAWVGASCLYIVATMNTHTPTGRYLLVAFPLIGLAASWLDGRRGATIIVVTASAALWAVLLLGLLHGPSSVI